MTEVKMANRAVVLIRSYRKRDGWSTRGLSKKEVSHLTDIPEGQGSYYMQWYEGSKRRSQALGRFADAAKNGLLKRRHELEANAAGVVLPPEPAGATKPQTAKFAVEAFLKDRQAYVGKNGFGGVSQSTVDEYSRRLAFFTEYIDSDHFEKEHGKHIGIKVVSYDMVRDFVEFLKAHPNNPGGGYVYNIVTCVKTLLLAHENKAANKVVKQLDYISPEVRSYGEAELKRYFAACKQDEEITWGFFLRSGGRENEVANFEVRQLLPASKEGDQNLLHFRHNHSRNFRLKSKKSENPGRYVEISGEFTRKLQDYVQRKKLTPTDLLFANQEGSKDNHLYRKCRVIAKRAGLDHKSFNLHSWRKTFATRLHTAGVPIGNIMLALGHTDLKTTLLYLGLTASVPSLSPDKAFAAFT
jgi:integrase